MPKVGVVESRVCGAGIGFRVVNAGILGVGWWGFGVGWTGFVVGNAGVLVLEMKEF